MLENSKQIFNMIKNPKVVLQKVDAVVPELTKERILVVSPSLGAYEVSNEG